VFGCRAAAIGVTLVLPLLLATAIGLAPYPLSPEDLPASVIAKITGGAAL
jgi:hypothetical protein